MKSEGVTHTSRDFEGEESSLMFFVLCGIPDLSSLEQLRPRASAGFVDMAPTKASSKTSATQATSQVYKSRVLPSLSLDHVLCKEKMAKTEMCKFNSRSPTEATSKNKISLLHARVPCVWQIFWRLM